MDGVPIVKILLNQLNAFQQTNYSLSEWGYKYVFSDAVIWSNITEMINVLAYNSSEYISIKVQILCFRISKIINAFVY